MDGNQNTTNNIEAIYCVQCGTLNDKKNNYCINCGVMINKNDASPQMPLQQNQQVNNNQPKEKEKNPYKIPMILLALLSVYLMRYFSSFWLLFLFIIIASLFSKKTRPFGLTIISLVVALFVFEFVIIIIIFGTCMAGLGG